MFHVDAAPLQTVGHPAVPDQLVVQDQSPTRIPAPDPANRILHQPISLDPVAFAESDLDPVRRRIGKVVPEKQVVVAATRAQFPG